jgi:hypothetical protein
MSKTCKAPRKDGRQCRADVQIGKDSCVFHDPLKAGDVHRGRRHGGIRRSRQVASFSSNKQDRPLTTSAEISSFLADTINQVKRQQLDPGVGNTIGYLATVQLASFKQGGLDDHVGRLEHCLGLIPRTPISNHLGEKEPNPGSIARRVKRVQREVEFQAWIRCKRILESMGEDELEYGANTGEWPNRPDPLPGTSRLDKMNRKELLELWKEDEEEFAGKNQEQLDFFVRHGHWPNQSCGTDCKAAEVESKSSDLPAV